ncbi:MAG: hypothetical protein QXI39_08790 [Candidatus Bathyarchaeia archaeon]
MPMERRLIIPLLLFAIASLVLSLAAAGANRSPPMGLSTILGVSVLGSSVLASSVLASTTILEAYSSAIGIIQPWLSLALILTLVYMELTDPSYGSLRGFLRELRKSWTPLSALLILLFFIIVAIKVWGILAA